MKLSPPRVRAAREKAELSQKAVALAARVSVDTVKRAENGLHEPGANALGRIARALGVTLDSLFVHGDDATSPHGPRGHGDSEKDHAVAVSPAKESAVTARCK